MKTTGNTILITGGSRGIGLEFAKQLIAAGNTVVVTGRDAKSLEKAKTLLPGLKTIVSDAGKTGDIEALARTAVAEYPALNVLINNAGIMREINFHEESSSLEELTREIEINLMGPIRLAKAFLPHLKTRGEAAIVNVSSGLAFVPLPISPVYCATKAALHSFTLSLRVQLKNTRVRVFEVAPPATETELLGDPNREDMKGVKVMKTDAMVAESIRGLADDRLEIRPGQANALKFMSRLAPDFILKQLSKPVDRMLAAKPGR
jgi:uncharacterized oxidoreductase